MANEEHVALLKQGVERWNRWRRQRLEVHPNLSGADLRSTDLIRANLNYAKLNYANLSGVGLNYAKLTRANLSHANLNRANLNHTELIYTNLTHSNLSYTDLSDANLNDANLNDAFLSGALLSGADLSRAHLCRTHLSDANLQGAIVAETFFAYTDLRAAKGLTEIIHNGPSHVELQTVRLPRDGSALHFLRGAGVPDEWIDFWRTTMMHPIQYHSLFISYSSKDEILARRLHADLQAHGVRCWFAPEDLKIGDKFRSRIDEAIHLHEKLLLILSESAVESTWVENEVEAAFEKEAREKRLMLFPIRIDESVLMTEQAWAANLRRMRHIGDFTQWTDPHSYGQAFERLLRDLKKETKGAE